MIETHDVIVVGSGAAGMTAALRARDLGLHVLVIEKAHKYGGTSAPSGGVAWIPNNALGGTTDTREETLAYLDNVIQQPVNRDRLEAYVDTGAEMLKYLAGEGISFISMPWPDYFAELPGSRNDRSLVLPMYDGRKLGEKFTLVREQYPRFKLFNRYAMNLEETFTIAARGKGWKKHMGRVIGRYWADRSTRKIGKRDRWFTSGNALVGPLLEKTGCQGGRDPARNQAHQAERQGRQDHRLACQPFRAGIRHRGSPWRDSLHRRLRMEPGAARSLLSN